MYNGHRQKCPVILSTPQRCLWYTRRFEFCQYWTGKCFFQTVGDEVWFSRYYHSRYPFLFSLSRYLSLHSCDRFVFCSGARRVSRSHTESDVHHRWVKKLTWFPGDWDPETHTTRRDTLQERDEEADWLRWYTEDPRKRPRDGDRTLQ